MQFVGSPQFLVYQTTKDIWTRLVKGLQSNCLCTFAYVSSNDGPKVKILSQTTRTIHIARIRIILHISYNLYFQTCLANSREKKCYNLYDRNVSLDNEIDIPKATHSPCN